MRLIDADALMDRFTEMQKVGETDGTEYACNFMSAGQEPSAEWYTIEDAVDNAPTVDAVPVVRCKDCDNTAASIHPNCVVCTEYGVTVREDFFCADGERKGGDGDE